MFIVLKWVILSLLSALGLVLATDPNLLIVGLILAFGCFLVFALDVARQFIN